MLKGEQAIMGLKNILKEAKQNKHVNSETKQTKKKKNLGFLGNDITHARTGLCTNEFSLRAQARSCIHRSIPRKPNLHRNKAEAKQNTKRKI